MSEHSAKRRRTDNGPNETQKITDPRFANIQNDPRYRLPGKKQKVKLDKRFARALKDEDFVRTSKVDRYGRPITNDSERDRLKRKFDFEEAESDEADDDDEIQQELARVEKTHDPLREGKDVESSSEETSSDEAEDEEVEEDVEVGQEQVDVPSGEVTSRIAAVNLDWDNIRAEDLMAVLSSFVPTGGRLLKVTIYPSQFGKERMEKEELEGPPQEIFATSHKGERDEEMESEDEDDEEAIKESIMKTDEGTEFDSTALRRYQRERLGYFYAVLNFSSTEVAKSVYDLVDGTEYMNSANFFDLRFIPDDTDFSDDKAREECQKLPEGYKPTGFVTDALQHSKVRLTWDADDGTRKDAVSRAFRGGQKEIDENDLKAYLGSDTSDDEDSDAGKEGDDETAPSKSQSKKDAERQRMRALLGLAEEPLKKSKKAEGPVGNVQITFSSGLTNTKADGTRRSVFENSPEPEETTVDKYVRKERERKQKRKDRLKGVRTGQLHEADVADAAEEYNTVEAAEGGEQEDLGFEDPFFAEPDSRQDKTSATKLRKEERLRKKAEREAEEAANAKERAELELLMSEGKKNGEAGVRHFDMNEIEKAEKKSRRDAKKKKKARKEGGQEVLQDGFKIDVEDQRFKKVFEDHEFAVDPTNPRFKGTRAMRELLDEGRRRKGKKDKEGEKHGAREGGVNGLVGKLKKRK